MPNTAKVTSSTKTRVDAIVTSEVSVVIVDTWHPSGRVRISHRSAQCGQTFSSQAGARKGTRLELGTQVHDYPDADKGIVSYIHIAVDTEVLIAF